ncbi:hypothetical protein [Paenibacillus xylaniclasticus]|uniref:hypothetical protein n=1 Tax=Paenibacillus xylaniclasticus TaxID=588083 RepID=UPI000FDAD5F8|nr:MULTISPECIES: hypothetical protein [Paenibacillus]GFN32436.1 hypothetical protein PCURB6_26960 [Paenibacillus curdlanolyticus]
MSKKFVIKEAWLLDEEGNKLMKLSQHSPDEVFQKIDVGEIRGWVGERVDKFILDENSIIRKANK